MASPAASSSASPSAPDPTPPRSPAPSGRALVLGGGGSTGHAWLVGVLAGLADAGLEVREADVTVGTPAGSTVAAQLTAARPGELYAPLATALVFGAVSAAAEVLEHGGDPGKTAERTVAVVDAGLGLAPGGLAAAG